MTNGARVPDQSTKIMSSLTLTHSPAAQPLEAVLATFFKRLPATADTATSDGARCL